MSVSFDEARHMVCQALGYDTELATTVLMTAMHAGQLRCDTRVSHGGGNESFITTGLPPSEGSVFDYDELLEFLESRLNPKRKVAVPPAPTSWPWGNHETVLLKKLTVAAEEWWSDYDSKNPSTAPTNADVTSWLIGQGVSKRVAEVMAQILRADGLPTGPKK
jgi:hypothetical protein